jgi:hypothetical protein
MSTVKIVSDGKCLLGSRIHNRYNAMICDVKIGTIYKNPSSGNYNMTYKGQEFYGSKKRLVLWLENLIIEKVAC